MLFYCTLWSLEKDCHLNILYLMDVKNSGNRRIFQRAWWTVELNEFHLLEKIIRSLRGLLMPSKDTSMIWLIAAAHLHNNYKEGCAEITLKNGNAARKFIEDMKVSVMVRWCSLSPTLAESPSITRNTSHFSKVVQLTNI